MNSNLLGMLGLARRGGMLVAGEEPVDAAIHEKNIRLLLLASDAADNTARQARYFAGAGSCILLQIPCTKFEIGRSVGRGSCAVLGITDIGFAAAVAHHLEEIDAPRYHEAAEKLDLKAKRAAERKTEQYKMEKAIRRRERMEQETAASKKTAAGTSGKKPDYSGRPPEKRTGAPSGKYSGRPSEKRTGAPSGKYSGRPSEKRTGAPSGKYSGRPPEKRTGAPSGKYSGRPPEKRTGAPSGKYSGRPPEKRTGGTFEKKPGRSFGQKPFRRSATSVKPYAHSHPVKKGKGSFRKKSEGK